MEKGVGIIGFGRMGRAIAVGLMNRGASPYSIIVCDKEPAALQQAKILGVRIAPSMTETVLNSDLVILAVKPGDIIKVVDEISTIAENKVVISIAALIPHRTIKNRLPRSHVYRAMPNIAVEVNSGFIALTPRGEMDFEVEKFFQYLGDVVWVDEETLDMLTLISASAPALLAEIADALILAALKSGIPYAIAKKAISSLFKGTGEMLNNKSVCDIRDSVITPRGVTIRLIEKFYTHDAKSKLLEVLSHTIEEYLSMLNEARDKYK
ncbi:MAG: pyrroline-5-carboxylate reductase [Ignisphaera sp.]|nr:pyrroline-5-carboxylate reductase [Ignisphaera sp.]MCX8168388.1 pyrroline-5-carboxylate reductase [Ignisphaera sp.]MDW8085780.1 pyrroline-5-carboxylate reductase [Ignisphaera sp.]